jgi:hypothetical protein
MTATASMDGLVSRVKGPVLQPGDEHYPTELEGFQTGIERRPDVVVGARDAQDVQEAVRFAAGSGRTVAVQATGHGTSADYAGRVLVSTRRLNQVTVDPAGRTARFGAGVSWKQVIEAAAPHGLAPLSGSAPDVGAVGYTLGGGYGLLGRTYGFASDRVRSVDVVTADGQLRQAGPDREPDLFWALRGGRDNFGIVTAMEVDLVPVASVFGGAVTFDAEHAAAAMHTFREWTATAPDTLTASLGMVSMPPAPSVPEAIRGKHVVTVRFAFTGDPAEGEDLVRPVRAIGPALLDGVGEISYTKSGTIYNDPPFAHPYYGNNALLGQLAPEALDRLLELAGPGAPVPSVIDIRHLGGAYALPPEVPSAVPHREAQYIVRVLAAMMNGVELADVRAAQAPVWAALRPWTVGRALGFAYGVSEPDEFVDEIYPAPVLRRLSAIKAAVDPGTLFPSNQTIPPAG